MDDEPNMVVSLLFEKLDSSKIFEYAFTINGNIYLLAPQLPKD